MQEVERRSEYDDVGCSEGPGLVKVVGVQEGDRPCDKGDYLGIR